jgi:hypothetical protein
MNIKRYIFHIYFFLFLIMVLFPNERAISTLLPPSISNPINNSIDNPLEIKFSWTSIPNAKYYEFEFTKDKNLNNIFFHQSGIKDTIFLYKFFENNTNYYCRIRSNNDVETSPWSNTFTFQTKKIDFDNGLVSLYSFEDPNDLGKDSKNLNNGTVNGKVVQDIGVIGMDAKFDGKTGNIKIPLSESLSKLQNMSVLYWTKYYKPTAGPNDVGTIICNGPDWPEPFEDGFYTYAATYDIYHYIGKWGDSLNAIAKVPYNGTIALDKQPFIYVGFIAGNDSVQSYKNSCLMQKNPRYGKKIIRPNYDWYIGWDLASYFLEGLLDELRIYNRPMPEEEVRELYRLNGGAVLITSSDFLNFGEHLCPIDSVMQIDFLNTGTASLKLEQIYLKGGNKSVFTYLGKNNYIIDTNGVEKVLVSYRPMQAGDFIDTLVIETPNACPKKIPLFGKIEGINYEILGLNRDTLDITLDCGKMQKDTSFSIINHTKATIPFTLSSLSLPFSYKDPAISPVNINSEEKKDIWVHFETSDTGKYFQQFNIIDTCGIVRTIYLKAVVHGGFKVALSGGDIFCKGDSSIIKAPGGYQDYEWYDAETGEKLSGNGNSLTTYKPGKYYARIKRADGCEGFSDTLEINSSGGSYLEVITSDGRPELDFDSTYYPKVICRTIKIKNLSNKPYILNEIFIFKNISFSIPQSQLPKLIPGKDSCVILVCYSPSEFGMETDSLFIDDSCVIHKVPLKAVSLKDEFSGDSKCNVMLRGKIKKFPNKYLLSISEPYPNPATDMITLGLIVRNDGSGFPEASLSNIYGNIISKGERLNCIESTENIQHLNIKFNIEGLSSGIYFIRIIVNDEYFTFPVLKME